MNFRIVGLMLVKSDSTRLRAKNTKVLKGRPMFVWNLLKCLEVFKEVYVSSDDKKILDISKALGAIPIKRPKSLCGDTPNIPVYQHALKKMKGPDGIVAVQANSPSIDKDLIEDAKYLMEYGFKEIMTCHKDYSLYGSIWAIKSDILRDYYNDPYNPEPECLLVDSSVDVHTKEDFDLCLTQALS